MATSDTIVPRFDTLFERMSAGDMNAADELVRLLTPGLSALIRRRVNAQDVEDTLQNALADLLVAINTRQLRDAQALPHYARTIAQRSCAKCIAKLAKARSSSSCMPNEDISVLPSERPDAEQLLMNEQKRRTAAVALSKLSPREREVLRRFYLEEQGADQICSEMGLTTTQFRLTKSRAKEKFGNIGRILEQAPARSRTEYATAMYA
jgi:RNA polymerase sigma-70 factor (ECF subfamily)